MRHAGNGLSCRSHNEVCLPSCHCCASGGHMHSSNSGVCRKQLQHHAEARQTVSHGCSSSELLQGWSAAMLRALCLVALLQKIISWLCSSCVRFYTLVWGAVLMCFSFVPTFRHFRAPSSYIARLSLHLLREVSCQKQKNILITMFVVDTGIINIVALIGETCSCAFQSFES